MGHPVYILLLRRVLAVGEGGVPVADAVCWLLAAAKEMFRACNDSVADLRIFFRLREPDENRRGLGRAGLKSQCAFGYMHNF